MSLNTLKLREKRRFLHIYICKIFVFIEFQNSLLNRLNWFLSTYISDIIFGLVTIYYQVTALKKKFPIMSCNLHITSKKFEEINKINSII